MAFQDLPPKLAVSFAVLGVVKAPTIEVFRCNTVTKGDSMPNIRRSLCVIAAGALPFIVGIGNAHAEGVAAGKDRTNVDTRTNLTDGDNFLVDVRVTSLDDDGDATGVRSRTSSSDLADVEDVRTDNRTVSNDEGKDATSARAILGFDDLRDPDTVDSDVDALTIDRGHSQNNEQRVVGQKAGHEDDEQQYGEDAEFVFGR